MKSPTITIFGGDSWVNRGDEAILRGTLKILDYIEPKPNIKILTGNVHKTSSDFPHHEAINRSNPFQVISAFKESDVILWGGGHLLQNTSSKVFLVYHFFILWLALIQNKRVIAFCLGAERLNGVIWNHFAKATLNRFVAITVRDSFSKNVIESLGVTKNILIFSDPALALTPSLPSLKANGIQNNYFIVSIRNWFDYNSSFLPVSMQRAVSIATNQQMDELIKVFARVCDYVVATKNLYPIFISMYPGHGQADELIAKNVMEFMRSKSKAYIYSPYHNFENLLTLINSATFVIGMRMHVTILSAVCSTPFISIYYQNKGKEFLSIANQDQFGIPVERTNYKSLVQLIEELLCQEKKIRVNLASSVGIQREHFSDLISLLNELIVRG